MNYKKSNKENRNFMSRPRLLIPVTIQFSIRYLLRTGLLQSIAEYAQPVVLLAWDDNELRRELADMGIETFLMPKVRYDASYIKIRRQIDAGHYRRLRSPSTSIDEHRATVDCSPRVKLIKKSRALYNSFRYAAPSAMAHLLTEEKQVLRTATNLSRFERLLDDIQPDAVFSVTPFHRQEELVLRACELRHLPSCAAILSFDNITTRGWIPVIFDRYLLWNRYNQNELLRAYPEVSPDQVAIVGPAQFDFYQNASYIWDEQDWRRKLSLPREAPIILFGAGPVSIAPHEPHFLQQLDEAIQEGALPGEPVILLRRHPMDTWERWKPVLNNARHVVLDDPWPSGEIPKYSNIRRPDIEKLVSTLCHSNVHVNTSSTMTIDGAIFDRPQVGPAYDDRLKGRYSRAMRELYKREHFLPIVRSGGLDVVHNHQEMIGALNEALDSPETRSIARKKMVEEICTFTDGKCAQRVAMEMRNFLSLNIRDT